MFNKTFVNSVGLSLDIFGACLIFRFGLPEKIDREGHIQVIVSEKSEKETLFQLAGKIGSPT